METKVCSKCSENKFVCDFGKSSRSKDGLLSSCRECNNKRSKQYHSNNLEKHSNRVKKYYQDNIEEQRVKHKEWRSNNLDCNKFYYEKNKESVLLKNKNWRENNKLKLKEYRESKKDVFNSQTRDRRKNNVINNLSNRIRSRMSLYVKKLEIKKTNRTFDIVGCTPKSLRDYLEEKFTLDMNWDNQGKWHIDHIIPLSSAKTEDELYKLCHYTNLQPLWAEDNLKKSNKIIHPLNHQCD
jgi:hypothetical protein